MTQSREKLSGTARWAISLSAAFVLCLLVFGMSYRPIRVAIHVRALRNPNTRAKAAEALKSMGLTGRMALLGAVHSDDDSTGMFARSVLSKALRDDIKAGRDIEPVIRKAIIGMSDPGEVGRRCTVIASQGWALGLLDERTKREVAKGIAGITINARSEYPVGMGRPTVDLWVWQRRAPALSFSYRYVALLDDRVTLQRSFVGPNTRKAQVTTNSIVGMSCFPNATAKPGRHTLQFRIELELTDIHIAGPFDPSNEIGWKTTLESEVVEINVRDDLPDDYLQAKVTPELE